MARFPRLTPEPMSAEQREVAAEIAAGPRGEVRGPFIALLHNAPLARRMQGLGEQLRWRGKLPPKLLARFTQLDYDRELALVAVFDGEFIAVGRYAPDADGLTAEFALAVGDAWQGKGVGRALLERLCDAARDAGYQALYGHILDANREMLELAARLGFVEHARAGNEVRVVRAL